MTDSDPVIAEIVLDNLPGHGVLVNVHLSDAPKVADLLEAAKRIVQMSAAPNDHGDLRCALSGCLLPNESGRTHDAEVDRSDWLGHFQTCSVLKAASAIRAFEPGWSP